ncbi:hypothetical protein [Agromyces lapidis]|uniref:DUF4229 domain-containing protein n=1 Tax=Agromyces lapidis TaxID=279574 RepID=A0ABV5SNM9_9MICO|nr:hypothetical protein [Agromyces lapidis]
MLVDSVRSLLLPASTIVAEKDEFDPNTVTPGVWGFVVTFLIMVVVLLLILDMVRRIRRTNYRAQVRAELEAEAAAEAAAVDEADFGDADAQSTDASADEPRDDDAPNRS